MKARIFRYLAAAANLAMLILALALPYLGGHSLFSIATGGPAIILDPEKVQHFGILSAGLWAMLILTLACAALWALDWIIPRWVAMLTQFVQLGIALCVSVFLLLFAGGLDNSITGIAWDVVTGLFGGESVLATYINPNYYTHLILSIVALLLGAFAEQDSYYEEDVPVARVPQQPPSLVECTGGPFKGEVFPIRTGETITFGRDPTECDVVFPADDLHVSRKHCEVSVREMGHVYDVVCTSANGMLVGGELCASGQKKSVKKGTIITVGDQANTFVLN